MRQLAAKSAPLPLLGAALAEPKLQRRKEGGVGVLFGGFGRKIEGFRFLIFTWWFHHLPEPSISPKRTPMGRRPL